MAPLAFAINQVFVLNPLLAPVWIAGLIAPFAIRELRALRFIPVAFALTAIAIVAGGGKDYYLAPAYPPLATLGAIALSSALRFGAARAAYAGVVVATSALIAPLALPILDPSVLVAYMQRLHLAPQEQERADAGSVLPSTFADMLGWHVFVAQVERAYARVPASERAATAILVDNYGEAAAIDVYGGAAGLPPALSGQNQYGFWGDRGQTIRDLIRVQDDPAALRPYCAEMHVLDTTSARYARSFETAKRSRTVADCIRRSTRCYRRCGTCFRRARCSSDC